MNQCPFYLFDTERKRNISRCELKNDISAALNNWFKIPVLCDEVIAIISKLYLQVRGYDPLRPYVFAAMVNYPMINDQEHFIHSLQQQLQLYQDPFMPIDPILQAVRALIDMKRAQRSPPPTARDIQEQIRLFGQYAILSHRWDGEELSFLDVEDLAEPKVQAKKGFKKLAGFSNIIKTHFGCRYLWIDAMCIDDESRNASILLMFSW